MKYYEVDFVIEPVGQTARELLAAVAGEAGFETFEDTDAGVKGYVQQQVFDESTLRLAIDDFPMPGVSVSFSVAESEDRDWNEQWEQQGFEPILVKGGSLVKGKMLPRIVIHDGRHFPAELSENNPKSSSEPSSPLIPIEIDAHQAFGTGTHETTRMVCSTLIDIVNLIPKTSTLKSLDCGTGTGILSICALKLGVAEAVGYDIDDWSVDNARHNAVINQVDERFTPLLGDSSILNKVEGVFDIVMANINRNILIQDMPQFRQKMAPGAWLILSGFYIEDVPLLTARASELGLGLVGQCEEGGWACMALKEFEV